MKHLKLILSLGTVVPCLWLAGCSKPPQDAASRAGAIAKDSGSEPVAMKLIWMTGKRYAMQMTMAQNAHIDVPGMAKPMDQQLNLTQNFSLGVTKELPDRGREMQFTFNREKIDNKMAGRLLFSFDTDNDPKMDSGNAVAPIMRKMVGASVTLNTGADGSVTQVIGFDKFLANFSDSGDPQSKALVGSLIYEDMIKQMASRGVGLPDKPVKIGDHWPVHLDMGGGPVGTLKMDMKYTFKGWQEHDGRKCAVLGFVGDIATVPGTSKGPANVSIDKGTMLGDSWFDPEMGMVVDTISDENLSLKIAMQGQNMTSHMKQTVGIKLLELADLPK